MVIYRKRGTNWRIELIVKDQRISGTFSTKREAQAWAVRAETRLRESVAGEIPDLAGPRPVGTLQPRGARQEAGMRPGTEGKQPVFDLSPAVLDALFRPGNHLARFP